MFYSTIYIKMNIKVKQFWIVVRFTLSKALDINIQNVYLLHGWRALCGFFFLWFEVS